MKDQLVNFVSRSHYPQTVFAAGIIGLLDYSARFVMIDAPCGNGETSWHFSKIKQATVHAYDIDPAAIANAQKRFSAKNVTFKTMDIYDAAAENSNIDYFCIVNSFFLFPDPAKLLQAVKKCLAAKGSIFMIVPNTKGKNFNRFEKENKHINKFELHRTEFETYFAGHALAVLKVKPLAYAHHYGRKDTRFLSIFSAYYLGFLNYFQTALKIGTPNYFLIELVNKPL